MSASETLRAYLRGRDDINPATVSSLLFFHENDLAAARAESDTLRAALTEAIAEAYCPATAGGTEGKWCLNHDTPMVTPAICAMVKGWMAALAPSPAEPAAPERCATCDRPMLSNAHEWDHEYQPSAPERWGREP